VVAPQEDFPHWIDLARAPLSADRRIAFLARSSHRLLRRFRSRDHFIDADHEGIQDFMRLRMENDGLSAIITLRMDKDRLSI
jgi:hypothetical protein